MTVRERLHWVRYPGAGGRASRTKQLKTLALCGSVVLNNPAILKNTEKHLLRKPRLNRRGLGGALFSM